MILLAEDFNASQMLAATFLLLPLEAKLRSHDQLRWKRVTRRWKHKHVPPGMHRFLYSDLSIIGDLVREAKIKGETP